MDRQRGDRYGGNPDAHHYRDSWRPPRSSDGPMHPRSPNNYRGGFPSGGGGGGGGGGPHQRPFESPPSYPTGGGGGFRPIGGGGFDSNQQMPPLSGQKRGYPYSGRGGSPDRFDGGSFAKLFVGSVPRTATEEDIRPLFEEYGNVLEVGLIKDKRTGQQQGCCFIKYPTSEEADRAIRGLHNQHTLPGGTGPIQVRYADGERERLGAVEYKLFVGSMNKQATEKEVEEIFSPYGRVEDVYLMRDDLKQSRGCGFVKFSHKDMAMSAINALNGKYTMKGCDQPLIVRFADPKRPRTGEARGPVFGGPGYGPRFQPPEMRPLSNLGEAMRDRGPTNAWHPLSPQGFGPSSNIGMQGLGSQLLPRSGELAIPSTLSGPPGSLGGPADGLLPGLGGVSSSPSQQQQVSPLQKPLHSPQHFPSALQLHVQTSSSISQTQASHASVPQLGQVQIPLSAGQIPFSQASPLGGQLLVSQPQIYQNAPSSAALQVPLNANVQPPLSSATNLQQLHAPLQQQLPQPLQQPPSEFAQRLTQQRQSLQAMFQSSQQAFSQVQQQFQLMQPSSRNLMPQQGSQVAKQQFPWAGVVPQSAVSAPTISPGADVPPASSGASVGPVIPQAVAPAKCHWTEHTSPDGFKYYYNSTTGQSTWEKPEELTLFEKQQQQHVSSVQLPQTQSHPQGLSAQQVPQAQQVHLQSQQQMQFRNSQSLQQSSLPSPYQASGAMGHQNIQELGYAQVQVAAGSVNDAARLQQGTQSAQDWMWKNKPTGA